MNKRYCLLLLLFTAFFVSNASAQHTVLFETWTNSCDPCPAPQRPIFDGDVADVLAAKGSQIIYLNHHVVNLCDPAAVINVNGGIVGARLSEWSDPNSQPIFYGAVDRTVFASTGVRTTPMNGGGSNSDWGEAIGNLANNAAPAKIELINATLDKKAGTSWTLHADVKVTALHAISDNIKIYFAVTQDNFTPPNVCAGASAGPFSDVVRWVDLNGTAVFSGSTSAGATKTISWSHDLRSPSGNASFKYADMKLVAFIEESSNTTDYHVVNAAQLKKNLDTLPLPPPSLAFFPGTVDGETYKSGDDVFIGFQMSHVDSVAAYYSLDNGSTWTYISNSDIPQFTWHVPDTINSQGKFKVVAVPDGTPSAISSGNFSIIKRASITLLAPPPNGEDTAKAGSDFTIRWQSYQTDTVTVRASVYTTPIDDGKHWITLGNKLVGKSSYTWKVPDTLGFARIEVAPSNPSDASAQRGVIVITKLVQNGSVAPAPASEFWIENIYPNPAQHVQATMQYHAREGAPLMLQIYDIVGREIYRQEMLGRSDATILLPTNDLVAGRYIVRLSNDDYVSSKQITVE